MANLLVGNLVYDPDSDNKAVKWCINLDALVNNFDNIVGFDDDKKLKPFPGPALFANGSVTVNRLQEQGALPLTEEIKQKVFAPYFTDSTAIIVDGAGHYLHAERPSQVCLLIKDFLDRVDSSE